MFMDRVWALGLGFCPCCVAAARFVPKSDGVDLGSALGLRATHSTRGGHVPLSHPALPPMAASWGASWGPLCPGHHKV